MLNNYKITNISYKEIREDLISNEKDLLNLQHYYTHKYRSQDRLVDIHVGIFTDNMHYSTVQIYVATKEGRIRERFKINKNARVLYDSIIQLSTNNKLIPIN